MFALRGPEFLVLFAGLSVVVYVIVHTMIVTREAGLPSEPRIRDPYTIAYLRGDTRELIRVVALSLCLRGLLKINNATFQTVTELEIDRVQLPIETVFLRLCRAPCQPAALARAPQFMSAVDAYQRDLTRRGLLANDQVKRARWALVLLGSALLVLLALMKISIALATGHTNIVFLIMLTVVAVFVLLGRVSARRTCAGNTALRNLANLFASLRSRRAPKSAEAVSEAALLAAVFGIYGVAGLQASAYARMFPTSDSSFVGTGSSCSSSGCGGGGGGGGGCGGCGS